MGGDSQLFTEINNKVKDVIFCSQIESVGPQPVKTRLREVINDKNIEQHYWDRWNNQFYIQGRDFGKRTFASIDKRTYWIKAIENCIEKNWE